MKGNTLLVLFFSGAILVASPLTLLAEKTEDQCRHAAELFLLGDLQGAQSELRAILGENPNYENAKVLLGVTLIRLSGQSEEKGDRTRAVAQLREALRLDPEEAYWHSALAGLLYEQGAPQEAAKECSLAAELSPDDAGLTGVCRFAPKDWKGGQINPQGVRPVVTHSLDPHLPSFGACPPVLESHSEPAYSEKARRIGYEGNIVLSLVVGRHGNVEEAVVVGPLGLGLDESALHTVRAWKFKPASLDGKPIPIRFLMEFSFMLLNATKPA